jgi:drug/metabolite transporter (DMT)-like permease
VSWWPFRQLQALGLHPLWATAMVYALAVAVIGIGWPRSWGQLARTPTLWLLVLASGTTNSAFNWAVTIGDVVRVVLLFYVMPLWAVLLARVLLHERIEAMALLRVALALAGAAVVLWPEGGGWPLPNSLADALGLVGGFAFALNNVLLRRESHRPPMARALAMFLGGCSLSALLALGVGVAVPQAVSPGWIGGAFALALMFLLGNLALQYGAARLRASVTAVVLVSEVLFAAVSALLLGAGQASVSLAVGGALIVAATLLAALRP